MSPSQIVNLNIHPDSGILPDPGTAKSPTRVPPAEAGPGPAPGDRLSLSGSLAPAPHRFQGTREEYFAYLDKDPALRAKAKADAIGAMLDLLTRDDVPESVEKHYTSAAGSPGGGRILLALDYTRGIEATETAWQALKKGPMHFLSGKILTPMLTHFREVGGVSLFPGDTNMTEAFRDSQLWGPKTNQVGHLLCAVETGARMGRLAHHGLESRGFDLGIKAATRIAGLADMQGNAADMSRAGIIGHEMIGDEDGSGFLGQMKAYAKLVANGDPEQIRSHWDQAVEAVQRGDNAAAFIHIDAISRAIEAPSTPAEVARNLANDHPRFAPAHQSREGNSRQDIALSVYGYAVGYQAMAKGLDSPAAARALFEARFTARGTQAGAIDRAAGLHPSTR